MTSDNVLNALSFMSQDARGEISDGATPTKLPLAVTLDRASEVLDLPAEEGRQRAANATYPVPILNLGSEGYRVSTANLVRAAGLRRVQDVLREAE